MNTSTTTSSSGMVAAIAVSRRHERGAAFMTAIFCGMILALSAAGVVLMLKQSMWETRKITNDTLAKMVATGGLERAVAFLGKTPTASLSSVPQSGTIGTGAGAGTFTITTTDLSGTSSGLVCLASNGTINNTAAQSRVYLTQPIDYSSALSLGIYAKGLIDGNGGSFTVGKVKKCDVYAVGTVIIDGKGLYGNASSSSATCVTNNSGYTDTPNAAKIPFPQVDSNYYYKTATSNNQKYTNLETGLPASAYTSTGFTPPGGVVWIESTSATTFKFNGNKGILNVKGIVVVNNASMDTTGNGDVTIGVTGSLKPGLIFLNGGGINMGGNGAQVINGAIYTDSGDVTFKGGATLNGSVLCGGSVSLSGGGNGDFVSPIGKVDIVTLPTDAQCALVFWEE